MKIVFFLLLIFVCICLGYDCQPTFGGTSYNFEPLQSPTDITLNKTNTKPFEIILNMCTSVQEKVCDRNVAICQVWDYNCPTPGCGSVSLGSTLNVTWELDEKDNVMVKFAGGDDGRISTITFVCNNTAGTGSPIYTNENPIKQYHVKWETAVACTVAVGCEFKYKTHSFQLSKLRNEDGNYVVNSPKGKFELNFCGQLINSPFNNSVGILYTSEATFSIGNSLMARYNYNATNEVIEVSFGGGYEGRSLNYFLICDPSIPIGSPLFFSESPLKTFNFVWATSVACISTEKQIGPATLSRLKKLLNLD